MPTSTEPLRVEIDNAWYVIDAGGPYLEIWHRECCQVIEGINVWDDETDTRAVEHTEEAVRVYVTAFLLENGDAYIRNVVNYASPCSDT